MQKKKVIITVSIIVCAILSCIVLAIAFNQPKHYHRFTDAKVYHVTNQGVYYTKECKDGCVKKYPTNITLFDALITTTAKDKIVLDEDIVIDEQIELNSFVTKNESPYALNLNVNLDLNNHKLSHNIESAKDNTMFMLNATYGSISLNISNGEIYSEGLNYIFRFKNNDITSNSISLNLKGVKCLVKGNKATPIFAHNESVNLNISANNSKFIAQKENATSDYGVGVFLNSDSVFNFNNCYFEGGDAVYVKRGNVNLTGCELANVGLSKRSESVNEEKFRAIGTCLAVESYATSNGKTESNVTIKNCNMLSLDFSTTAMIYVAQTGEEGQARGINPNSKINIIYTTFSSDPSIFINNDITYYAGNKTPTYDEQLSTWVAG